MNGRRRGAVLLAVALLVLTGACSGDSSGPVTAASGSTPTTSGPKGNKVSFVAKEYSYEVSGSITAGHATVELVNAGKEIHMVAPLKLKAGKTLTDLLTALQSENADTDSVAESSDATYATPQLLSGGAKSAVTTSKLTAGSYGIVCFLAAPDGKPHFAKGMATSLEVKPAPAEPIAPPRSDGEITLTEGRVTAPANLGVGTWKITNTGGKTHDFTVVKPNPGKTTVDVFRYYDAHLNGEPVAGEPPGTIVGGVGDMNTGDVVYLRIDLPPGAYGYVCTQRDDDGRVHVDAGEHGGFTVA